MKTQIITRCWLLHIGSIDWVKRLKLFFWSFMIDAELVSSIQALSINRRMIFVKPEKVAPIVDLHRQYCNPYKNDDGSCQIVVQLNSFFALIFCILTLNRKCQIFYNRFYGYMHLFYFCDWTTKRQNNSGWWYSLEICCTNYIFVIDCLDNCAHVTKSQPHLEWVSFLGYNLFSPIFTSSAGNC